MQTMFCTVLLASFQAFLQNNLVCISMFDSNVKMHVFLFVIYISFTLYESLENNFCLLLKKVPICIWCILRVNMPDSFYISAFD